MLEKLSDEQVKMMPSIVEQCLKIGFDTKPINKVAAKRAVLKAYRNAGVALPKEVKFLSSPFEGALEATRLSGATTINSVVYPFYGSFEIAWLSFYLAFKKFGLKDETQKIEGLLECAYHCGWVWFFDDVCLVTEKPMKLFRDNQGRLHNLKGPAIEYSDGYKMYFVNGVSVDERWIMYPLS